MAQLDPTSPEKDSLTVKTAEELAEGYFDGLRKEFTSGLQIASPGAAALVTDLLEEAKRAYANQICTEVKALELDQVSTPGQAEERVSQLRALAQDVAKREISISAERILNGYKKFEDGSVQIVLPIGMTVLEAGSLLDDAAGIKGVRLPLFFNLEDSLWHRGESDDHRTEQGLVYRFKIDAQPDGLEKLWEGVDMQSLAPVGAIVIAEACERLLTSNSGSLLSDAKMRVLGANPEGITIRSDPTMGVMLAERSVLHPEYHHLGLAKLIA